MPASFLVCELMLLGFDSETQQKSKVTGPKALHTLALCYHISIKTTNYVTPTHSPLSLSLSLSRSLTYTHTHTQTDTQQYVCVYTYTYRPLLNSKVSLPLSLSLLSSLYPLLCCLYCFTADCEDRTK